MTSSGKTKGSLVAFTAAALASPVALAPATLLATNLTNAPAELASISNDALIRVAQYQAVRRQYVIRPLKKPRFLPPNPCRTKSNVKRC